MTESPADRAVLDAQRQHWSRAFDERPDRFGADASRPVRDAVALFNVEGVRDVLELGAGQGRDTLALAREGFRVVALDYADSAVAALREAVAGLGDAVTVSQHDVRRPLPFEEGSFDACYSHMLFCMALTTAELEALAAEVRRVLRPGGLVVYTARTTEDAHYGAGIARGDDMYEMGGFIVHYFGAALVERLAAGYEVLGVGRFEEGELPRRLVRVTMRRPAAP